MNNQPKLLAVLTAAALLSGCASGGGSGGSGSKSPSADPALQPLRPGYEPSPCGTYYGYPVPCVSRFPRFPGDPEPGAWTPPPPPVPFTSWSDHPRGGRTEGFGSELSVEFRVSNGLISPISASLYDVRATGVSDSISFFSPEFLQIGFPDLGAVGQPGIQVGVSPFKGSNTAFASISTAHIGIAANPHVLGWNYQSFGIWENSAATGPGRAGAMSFGAITPGSAIPTIGTATFSGKLAGLYVSPAGEGSVATADVSVAANFSTRSLDFSSSKTVTTRDMKTATAASQLNLKGTLTYSPGSNSFTGTLTNAGGSMTGPSKGQFYGPAAQELGGTFAVKSPTTSESFAGAYGAKR